MIQGTDASHQQVRLLTMTELEKCLREALYADNVGCPETVLYEISQATYHDVFMARVSKAVWSCLKSRAYRWRRIQKALTLLHYLALNGSEVAIREILDHMDEIIALQTAKMLASNPNAAMLIRDKAIQLVSLVCDLEQLKKKRMHAAEIRERFISVGNNNGRLEKSVLHKPVYAVNMQGDQPTAVATGHGRPQPASSSQFLSTLFRKRTKDPRRPGSALARLFFGRRNTASMPVASRGYSNGNSRTMSIPVDSRDPFPLAQRQQSSMDSSRINVNQRAPAAQTYSSDSSSSSSSSSSLSSSSSSGSSYRHRGSRGRNSRGRDKDSSRRVASGAYYSSSSSSSSLSRDSGSSRSSAYSSGAGGGGKASSRRHYTQHSQRNRHSRASIESQSLSDDSAYSDRDGYGYGYSSRPASHSRSRSKSHSRRHTSAASSSHHQHSATSRRQEHYPHEFDDDGYQNGYQEDNRRPDLLEENYAYYEEHEHDASYRGDYESGYRSRARHPRHMMRMDGRINNVHKNAVAAGNAYGVDAYPQQYDEDSGQYSAYNLASGPGANVVANATMRGIHGNSRNVHSAYSVGPSHAGSHPMAAFPSRASVTSRVSHGFSGAASASTGGMIGKVLAGSIARDTNTVVSSRSSTLNNPFAK